MQSLETPFTNLSLGVTKEPTQMTLYVNAGVLPPGQYVIVIMDKNSYANTW